MIGSQAIHSLLLSLSVTIIVACGGSGSSSPGITVPVTVTLQAQTPDTSPAAGSIKSFTTAEGVRVDVQEGFLTVWSLELLQACDSSFFTRLPARLFEAVFPSAHAHADDSPTVIGTTRVLLLDQADGQLNAWGSFSPPPGDYCGLLLLLFPADEDAEDLPATPPLVGTTLYVAGQYTLPGAAPVAFTVNLPTRLRERGLTFPALLVLDAEQRAVTKTLSIAYDTWFDGIDFTQLDSTSVRNQLLENVRQSASVD